MGEFNKWANLEFGNGPSHEEHSSGQSTNLPTGLQSASKNMAFFGSAGRYWHTQRLPAIADTLTSALTDKLTKLKPAVQNVFFISNISHSPKLVIC